MRALQKAWRSQSATIEASSITLPQRDHCTRSFAALSTPAYTNPLRQTAHVSDHVHQADVRFEMTGALDLPRAAGFRRRQAGRRPPRGTFSCRKARSCFGSRPTLSFLLVCSPSDRQSASTPPAELRPSPPPCLSTR